MKHAERIHSDARQGRAQANARWRDSSDLGHAMLKEIFYLT